MKIKFYSTFSEYAGVKVTDISFPPNSTVQDVVDRVISTYPALKPVWLNQHGELHVHVHIGINQVDVMAYPDQMATVVSETDEIDFYPPITGG